MGLAGGLGSNGGSNDAPGGAAGGDLSGTYPNPSVAALAITNAKVAAGAAIAESKLSLASDAAAGTASRRTVGKGALQAADGADTEYAFSAWKDLSATGNAVLASALAAGTYILGITTAVLLAGTASAGGAFYLDPADYAPGGTRSGRMRLRAWITTNAVAPTVNFTFGLYPITSVGGASNVDPTIATVGAAVMTGAINTPAATTQSHVESAATAFPVAGWYCLAVVTSGLKATNAIERTGTRLQVQTV